MPKTSKKKPISKTAFVLGLPADMPAKEVVEKAKAAGITISEGYTYEIRSAAKRKAKKAGNTKAPKAAAPAKTKAKLGRKPKARTSSVPARGSAVIVLSRLVVEHGIGKVRELLDEVESRVARVLAGE